MDDQSPDDDFTARVLAELQAVRHIDAGTAEREVYEGAQLRVTISNWAPGFARVRVRLIRPQGPNRWLGSAIVPIAALRVPMKCGPMRQAGGNALP